MIPVRFEGVERKLNLLTMSGKLKFSQKKDKMEEV